LIKPLVQVQTIEEGEPGREGSSRGSNALEEVNSRKRKRRQSAGRLRQ
jgi:hypothetical protein